MFTYGSLKYAGRYGIDTPQTSVALLSLFEYLQSSPVALFTKLEAEIWRKEHFHPDQIWIKEPTHE